MYTDIIRLIDYAIFRRRFIIWVTSGFTLGALILSLIIRPTYTATAILMPPTSQGVSLMALAFQGSFPAEPEIGGTGYMPGMVTPSNVFAYMLKSGSVANIVIRECGLIEHYKLSKIYKVKPEKANYMVAKTLRLNTSIQVTDDQFISISVKDKDRQKAAQIANSYVMALNRVYAEMNMTQGGKMREFIEKRLDQEASALAKAEDSLSSFQLRNRTISLTDEMTVAIEIASKIEAEIIRLKSELEFVKESSTEENPQVIALRTRIAKMEEQLKGMESGRDPSFFTKFSKAPAIAMELGRRTRDVKIHSEVYSLLRQQYEQAKILEAKDTPKIQFLDKAVPPYRKSAPKRSLIVIAGMLIGFLSSVLALVGQLRWREYLMAPERYPKVTMLLKVLLRK